MLSIFEYFLQIIFSSDHLISLPFSLVSMFHSIYLNDLILITLRTDDYNLSGSPSSPNLLHNNSGSLLTPSSINPSSGLLVGASSQQGKRPYQEDEYNVSCHDVFSVIVD